MNENRNILNGQKEWDTITVRGKLTQKKETTIIGARKLKLCEALLADTTASIQFDIFDKHIAKFSVGKVYQINPVQVWV